MITPPTLKGGRQARMSGCYRPLGARLKNGFEIHFKIIKMKFISSIIFLLIGFTCLSQTIPIDSMYIGQTPPDEIPKRFNLFASPTFAAVERITISKDGRTVVYHENNGYDKSSIGRIRTYSYLNNKWTSSVVFDGFTAPSFSVTDDTLFVEKDNCVWYSTKDNDGWTNPIRFDSRILYWHYYQITNSGTLYASLKNQDRLNKKDWSSINIINKDTIVKSLGTPINSMDDNLDFYISRDESYIVFSSGRSDLTKYGYFDLFISFKTKDNLWTTPQNLGQEINKANEVRWGPYVSPDKKYLFYSRSSTQDNSDACTNWVRIDKLVDRLRQNCRFDYK
jgi:hypothetical protein